MADTLNALQQDGEGVKAAAAAVDAANVTLNQAKSQFQAGYANYLALLSAEQAYQQAEINLVQAQANRYTDTAALFRSVVAIMVSSDVLPPAKTRLKGASPSCVGKGRPWPGGLGFHSLRGGAGVNKITRHTAIHQQNLLPRHAFPIERRTQLQCMRHIVADGHVLAHHLLAHAVIEARPLIENGGSREVVKEKANQVEDRSLVENDRPTAGLDFLRMARGCGLLAGALGQRFRIDLEAVGCAGLGPARGVLLQNGDRKFGPRLAIGGEKSLGIHHGRHRSAGGEDAGGSLAILLREFGHSRDRHRTILRRRAGGPGE